MKENNPGKAITGNKIFIDGKFSQATIIIKNGIIKEITSAGNIPSDFSIEDCEDLCVTPGLVDTHVHINEPGRTDWEGFETATKSAAAGGITTLIDMPLNSTPVTINVEALKEKIKSAENKIWVDCGFYGGLIPGNENQIENLIKAGVIGIKAFLVHSGIDDFPNATEKELRSAMPVIAKYNIPLLVHCELMDKSEIINLNDRKSYNDYLDSRLRKWENEAINLMIKLCEKYDCRTHIVHLSSTDLVSKIEEVKKSGSKLTVETCPHYLFFASEEIPDGDTRYKCAPPIRENENREKLWDALNSGVIDFIVSDHSPAPPKLKKLKEGDFQTAWGGISSLQLGLSIILAETKKRNIAVGKIINWMSEKPAQFAGLGNRKGKIKEGYDADIIAWNPDFEFTVDATKLFHKHKITPYDGKQLFGKVEKTFLSGERIYSNGEFSKIPNGRILKNTIN